jgi:hypothetical protein
VSTTFSLFFAVYFGAGSSLSVRTAFNIETRRQLCYNQKKYRRPPPENTTLY